MTKRAARTIRMALELGLADDPRPSSLLLPWLRGASPCVLNGVHCKVITFDVTLVYHCPGVVSRIGPTAFRVNAFGTTGYTVARRSRDGGGLCTQTWPFPPGWRLSPPGRKAHSSKCDSPTTALRKPGKQVKWSIAPRAAGQWLSACGVIVFGNYLLTLPQGSGAFAWKLVEPWDRIQGVNRLATLRAGNGHGCC